MFQTAEVEEERVDERSVDDLLSFINGGGEGILSVLRIHVLQYIC